MKNVLLIFMGSGLGGICRYNMYLLIAYFQCHSWVSTIICNLTGSFFISVFASFIFRYDNESMKFFQQFLITGFLGGFTTFSTFSIDAIKLFQENAQTAIIYICVNLIGSLIMCFLGFKLMDYLFQVADVS